MKVYSIGESSIEKIEFRVHGDTYALVQTSPYVTYKTIIMNQREILLLYQALQEEIVKLGVLKNERL